MIRALAEQCVRAPQAIRVVPVIQAWRECRDDIIRIGSWRGRIGEPAAIFDDELIAFREQTESAQHPIELTARIGNQIDFLSVGVGVGFPGGDVIVAADCCKRRTIRIVHLAVRQSLKTRNRTDGEIRQLPFHVEVYKLGFQLELLPVILIKAPRISRGINDVLLCVAILIGGVVIAGQRCLE